MLSLNFGIHDVWLYYLQSLRTPTTTVHDNQMSGVLNLCFYRSVYHLRTITVFRVGPKQKEEIKKEIELWIVTIFLQYVCMSCLNGKTSINIMYELVEKFIQSESKPLWIVINRIWFLRVVTCIQCWIYILRRLKFRKIALAYQTQATTAQGVGWSYKVVSQNYSNRFCRNFYFLNVFICWTNFVDNNRRAGLIAIK